MDKGRIRNEEAYAQGKMLCHSGWAELLPRNITPSDVDMIFDNDGKILAVELKPDSADWDTVKYGQRQLYMNLVRAGRGRIYAALARYHTEAGEQINTVTDISEFSFLCWRNGQVERSRILPGDKWVWFVRMFMGAKSASANSI